MSDDFHRPTYTSPNVHGAYNPTQVRLYGIRGLSGKIKNTAQEDEDDDNGAKEPPVVTALTEDVVLAVVGRKPASIEGTFDKLNDVISPLRRVESSFIFLNTNIEDYMIMLSAIDLYPTEEEKKEGQNAEKYKRKREFSAGVIFGYSYEGHCYDLPKPKIMLIPALPRRIPVDDCGYDLKRKRHYKVWIVDKLDQCLELELNQGFIEQLILEANLPGKRSPTAYVGKMMLAHRSGRLTE